MSRRERIWSLKEVKLLTEQYSARVPICEIAALLKRTPSAIRTRIQILGLIRNEWKADSTVRELMEIAAQRQLTIDPNLQRSPRQFQVYVEIASQGLESAKSLASRLGITIGNLTKVVHSLKQFGRVADVPYSEQRYLTTTLKNHENPSGRATLAPDPCSSSNSPMKRGTSKTLISDRLDLFNRSVAGLEKQAELQELMQLAIFEADFGDLRYEVFLQEVLGL